MNERLKKAAACTQEARAIIDQFGLKNLTAEQARAVDALLTKAAEERRMAGLEEAEAWGQPQHRHDMTGGLAGKSYGFGQPPGFADSAPDHDVAPIGRETKMHEALGTKAVDEEAAYGWLGMTLKNSILPQPPEQMERWERAAGIDRKDLATSGSAGTLIPTPIAAFLIDVLRNHAVTQQLGAQVVPMTASTLKVNRRTGDVTASWLNEAAAVTFTDTTFDSVTLTAHRLEAGTKVSMELAEDSSDPVDAGQAVASSIAAAMALELDRVTLRGSGTNPEPKGIRNQTGVNLVALGTNGGAASYDTLLNLQSTLATGNVDGTAFVFNPRTAYALAGLKDSQNRYLEPPQAIAGPYGRSLITNALPTNIVKGTSSNCTEIYAGDWSQVLVGMRVQLTLQTLTELFRANGQIGIVGRLRADVALRHGPAFAVVTDVTN